LPNLLSLVTALLAQNTALRHRERSQVIYAIIATLCRPDHLPKAFLSGGA
jgi:hypothetical protein